MAGVVDVDESSAQEDHVTAFVSDYLLQRRKAFDSDGELLRGAALKVTPNYSDDEIASNLEQRSMIAESSSIKPCRPYKDIDLEY